MALVADRGQFTSNLLFLRLHQNTSRPINSETLTKDEVDDRKVDGA